MDLVFFASYLNLWHDHKLET